MAELGVSIVVPEQKEVKKVKGTENRTKFAKHLIKSGVYKPSDIAQISLIMNKQENREDDKESRG